jgi:hypothetical protein
MQGKHHSITPFGREPKIVAAPSMSGPPGYGSLTCLAKTRMGRCRRLSRISQPKSVNGSGKNEAKVTLCTKEKLLSRSDGKLLTLIIAICPRASTPFPVLGSMARGFAVSQRV